MRKEKDYGVKIPGAVTPSKMAKGLSQVGVDGWGSSLKIPKRKGDAGDASKARPAGGDVEDVREGQLGTEDCGAGVSSVSPRARKQRRKTIGVQRFGDWFAGDIEEALEGIDTPAAQSRKREAGESGEEDDYVPTAVKGRVARRQTIAPGVAPRDEEEEAGRGRRPARRQTLGPRAGVDEEVARIRSLTEGLSMAADALLPGASGTPGPAGREEDTRTLRERLHAAWGGKSYYERLQAELGDSDAPADADDDRRPLREVNRTGRPDAGKDPRKAAPPRRKPIGTGTAPKGVAGGEGVESAGPAHAPSAVLNAGRTPPAKARVGKKEMTPIDAWLSRGATDGGADTAGNAEEGKGLGASQGVTAAAGASVGGTGAGVVGLAGRAGAGESLQYRGVGLLERFGAAGTAERSPEGAAAEDSHGAGAEKAAASTRPKSAGRGRPSALPRKSLTGLDPQVVAELDAMRSELGAASRKEGDLEKEAARLARELSERDRQLQASEAARRDLEKKAEDARREAKARAAEASRAAADAEAARKERDAARRERDAAGRERDRAAQEGEELRDKVRALQRGLDAERAAADAERTRAAETERKARALEKQIAALETRARGAMEAMRVVVEEFGPLRKAVGELHS